MEGLKSAASAAGQNLLVQGPGPMFCISFTDEDKIKDYRDTFSCDKAKLSKFISAMHDRHIRIIGRGLVYISAVHTREDIDHAISVASEVIKQL